MRIGIDLGGTKIEALALDETGLELARLRVNTPQNDYHGTIAAMVDIVHQLEAKVGAIGSVGAGIPGTIRAATGLVKNANSIWLNGKPLQVDLSAAMGREVRIANDANCLAVSEATDGAAQEHRTVFAVILGTGCGGGLVVDGRIHAGPNGIGGEWGHTPLPWPTPSEFPGPPCYCGKHGCMEQWVSGPAIARDFFEATGRKITTREIATLLEAGDHEATEAIKRFENRLARGLTQLVNILDPDVIVFGGGVSHVKRLYANVPPIIRSLVFGGDFDTPLLPATYGDSSGVRGAAWLWPPLTKV